MGSRLRAMLGQDEGRERCQAGGGMANTLTLTLILKVTLTLTNPDEGRERGLAAGEAGIVASGGSFLSLELRRSSGSGCNYAGQLDFWLV